MPIGWHAHANGLRIDVSEELDIDVAEDAASWSAEQWQYRYAASYGSDEYSVREPGEYTHAIGGVDQALSVRALDPPLSPGAACRVLEPTGLTFVIPEAYHAGPRLVWAGVSGEQSLCCSPELLLATRQLEGDGRAIELQLYTCTFEDCLCGIAPPPTPATAWHDLGELAPGDYTVRVGDLVETLRVR